MELELGLKITKTKDDIDSISEYQFMKDAGPVFHSRETNTMFILSANLKGYKRNNIDIKISKDGNKISIIGKKPIQEMVMMGWVMQRKVVNVKGFNKVFKIPHGVNLDKIKANHNEEEWMMNIVMPKLVKGICGLKIEEFKEQEKSEIDQVSSSVGETSQKGSKDCEFQHMEGSENAIEKMLDDTNKITTQKEVRGSKLRFEDGNDEVNRNIRENEKCKLRIEDSKIKDTRENDGKETYEALKTLEDMEKKLNETSKDINEETIEKEVGDSKLRIENENGESTRDKVGKEEYEVTKKSERDQGVGVFISNKFEDASKDKKSEDQKMDSGSSNKRHDDVNRDIIGGTIKEEEKEESNLRSEESEVKDIDKGTSYNITETSQRVFEESVIQQSGKSKQKESKEHSEKSEKENSMEPFEAIKVLEVEHDVVGHIPSKIGCINKNEFEESRIPQMEKTTSTKGKIIGGEYEKLLFEANQDFQKEMIKPKMKTKDGDQECVLEKLGGKEEFDVEDTIENGIVKLKEDGYIMMGENGLKESGHEKSTGIEGSTGFNFANKEQNEVINDALVEDESLIMEGGEYKEKTKEIVQDEEDENKHGIVKLKGEGCTKIHGETNEPFEAENVNIGIFDGRKTQKFQEIEQTEDEDEDEDVNEEGTNIKKSMKKVIRDKYEKVKNEENEGFDKNKTKKKDERFSQEETSKGVSKASNASKEVFPNKMLDSLVDTRDGRKNTRIEKTKGIKESVIESSMEPFEAMNVSKLERFEANDDDHKNFIKPKRETKDDEPKGKKPNKEGFDAKITINEEFPKNLPTSTHEESEGLNDLKMQETKDVKEYVVKRKGKEIEYFREKDEGDRLKMMDMEAKKVSNTKETMQEEIEKIENGIKESGQQHANKNTKKEMDEVSKIVTKELKQKVGEIDESKKEKGECYLPDDVSERIYQDTKDAKKDFPMKMVDSQIDTKEELKDRKIVPFGKKVRFEEKEFKERTTAMDVDDEEVKNDYGIVKLKEEGSTKITQKFQEKEEIEDVNEHGEKTGEFVKKVNEKIQNEKDEGFKKDTKNERDECFLQEEISEGRSRASKVANEPFEDIIEKENRNKKLDPIDELIEKENVGIGIVDGRKIQKFQEMNQTRDAKKTGANSEKTMKKMSGNKEESEKVEQVEANEGLRNDIEEQNLGESMTKEELQEFEMERIRNPAREFKSVVIMGFKEFDFKNESMNQEVFSPKKPKEVGENRTRNKIEEFETIEDQVINQISVPRFQSEKDIEKVGETLQEKTDEPEKKIDDREQENAARDDAKVETKEKDSLKECKTTQKVNDEKCKIDGEIAKSGIEKFDKKKWIHETMKTTWDKERSVKFEVGEKEEEESLDKRLKNDIAEMKTNRDYEQHEYGAEEIKAPKTTTYEEAKPSMLQRKRINQQSKDEINKKSECVFEEHEATKEFSPKNAEKGKVVKKKEGLKVADREETKDNSTLTTTQTTEEKKPKMKEITSQFDLASGSKRVSEKVHEHQRKSDESTSNFEGEEKTKKNEIEQCINKEQEAKHGIEEIEDEEKDNEQVYEEQKEDKDETCEGKKDNAKISKKLLVPLVIAGSALLATIVFIFVKNRRSRKM